MTDNKKTNKRSVGKLKKKETVKKPNQTPVSPEVSENSEENNGKEVQLKSPIIVKNLADALNKKPTEIMRVVEA